MLRAEFRFYASLNDFLPLHRRGRPFVYTLEGRASVKDTIEALGVPHTEVDLILINGEPVGFNAIVEDGDRVSVYPPFTALDISPLPRMRPASPDEPRFVLDQHLGRLAAYLRMLGFDTLYRNDYTDPELAAISAGEGRTLLTRDRGLLKRRVVTHGYCVRSTDPREQVAEVVRRFDLVHRIKPFRRCAHCNGVLEPVRKEDVADRLEPRTLEYYDEFRRCTGCGRVYWKGSHYDRMLRLIDPLRGDGTG